MRTPATPMHDPAWTDRELADPHAAPDKARRVRAMFAAIAPSYDLNNRIHSLGRDQAWRRAAVAMAELRPQDAVLDVACGTGDLTLAFAEALRHLNAPQTFKKGQVLGVDFTFEMLPLARDKAHRRTWPARVEPADSPGRRATALSRATLWVPWVSRLRLTRGLGASPRSSSEVSACPGNPPVEPCRSASRARTSSAVGFVAGDALRLPLPDECVDVVSIAFGIRNVADPAAALREFHRVLRPGGRLIVLEFSLPTNAVLRGLYNIYFQRVLPRTATLIARDRSGAYRYLPQSVNTFIDRAAMTDMMAAARFTRLAQRPLTMGIAVVYRGVK